MSEQPNVAALLREASERLAEAVDKLDAAQLLEQERRDKLHASFREVVKSVGELSDLLLEIVP